MAETSWKTRAGIFLRAQRKRTVWYRLLSAMAMVVVFITTYLLILPAITMESKAECGKPEHQHGAACYSTSYEPGKLFLVCTREALGIHEHTEACYDASHKQICGYADYVIHQHDAFCYGEDGVLQCTLPEVSIHSHTADCWKTETILICGQEETAGHHHDTGCYTRTKGEQICIREEHQHTEACYDESGELICETEEHVHTDDCYMWSDVLTCAIPESDGHTHSDACCQTTTELICDQPDELHTHTETCFTNGVLTCGKTELKAHQHTEACRKQEQVLVETLICGQEEHQHTDECFAAAVSEESASEEKNPEEITSEESSDNNGLTDETEAELEPELTQEAETESESEKEIESESESNPIIIELETDAEPELESELETEVETEGEIEAETEEPESEGLTEAETEEPESEGLTEPETEEPESEGLTEPETEELESEGLTEPETEEPESEGLTEPETEEPESEELTEPETEEPESESLTEPETDETEADTESETEEETETMPEESRPEEFTDWDVKTNGALFRVWKTNSGNQSDSEEIFAEGGDYADTEAKFVVFAARDSIARGAVDFKDYLIGSEVAKLENGQWAARTTFTDGDQVRVALHYNLPSNLVHAGQKQIYYQLPDGVRIVAAETGDVVRNGEKVGTYTIDTEGLILIEFDENFADGDAFEGEIEFYGTVTRDGCDESGSINFGGSTTAITVKEDKSKHDLSVKKVPGSPVTGADGKTTIHYKVEAATVKGTDPDERVTLIDQIGNNTNVTAEYDKTSLKVYKVVNGQRTEVTVDSSDISYDTNGKGFQVGNLSPLGAGESYEMEYDVTVSDFQADGSGKIQNSAGAKAGDKNPWDWKETTLAEPAIQKSGSYNNQTGKITWTITVNNPSGRDLNGTTISDLLKTTGVDYTGNLVIKGSSWQETADSKTVSAESFGQNGYKFPEGSTDTKYYLEYTTTAPDIPEGETSASVVNQAKRTDGEKTYETPDITVGVHVRSWSLSKWYAGVTENGENRNYKWGLSVQMPDRWDEFTIMDTILDAVNAAGTVQEGTHYAIAADLYDYIQQHLKLSLHDGSIIEGIDQLSDYLTITDVICYDKDGNGVAKDDRTTPVKSFRISVTPKEGAAKTPVQIKLEGYPTVADCSGMPGGETWTFRNDMNVPGQDTKEASNSYRKPKPIEKMAGIKNGEYSYGDRIVSYNSQDWDGNLYYQLLVYPTDLTGSEEIVITDILPEGSTWLDDKWSAVFYRDSYNMSNTDWNGYDFNGAQKPDVSKQIITTADGKQKTQVTITIKAGYQEFTRWGAIAFRYALSVKDDPRWKDLGNEELKYQNTAEWKGSPAESTTTVERNVPKVGKAGEQVPELDENGNVKYTTDPVSGKQVIKYTNRVQYSVVINPAGDVLNPDSDRLILKDTMKLPTGVKAGLDVANVILYKYEVDENGKQLLNHPIDPNRYSVKFDVDSHVLTVDVPDELACVLVYTYEIDWGNINEPQLSNAVNLAGQWDSSVDTKLSTVGSSATVKKGRMIIYKVDSGNNKKTLPGAEFTIHYYDKANGVWSDGKAAATNANGELEIDVDSRNSENLYVDANGFQLKPGILYRLQETKAPDGYAKKDKCWYMIWLDENGSKTDRYYQQVTGKQSVRDVDGITEIKWDDAKYYEENSNDTFYVPNNSTSVAVKKIWVDENKNEITPNEDSISVKLVQHTETLRMHQVTVYVRNNEGQDILKGQYEVAHSASLYLENQNWEFLLDVWNGENLVAAINKRNGESQDYKVAITVNSDMILIVTNHNKESWKYWPDTGVISTTVGDIPDSAYDKSSKDYATVDLTKADGWQYIWKDLPATDETGKISYYYTAEEVSKLPGYSVSYRNNGGIQFGEIYITNRKEHEEPSYTLPETGGFGTYWYTMAGLFLIAAATLLMYKKQTGKGGSSLR